MHARGGALARSAYLLTGDAHLAEDLLQETLARVAQKWRKVEREGSPDAYARTGDAQPRHRLLAAPRRPSDRGARRDAARAGGSRRRRRRRTPRGAARRAGPAHSAPARGAVAALLRGPDRGRGRRPARLLGQHQSSPPPARRWPGCAPSRPTCSPPSPREDRDEPRPARRPARRRPSPRRRRPRPPPGGTGAGRRRRRYAAEGAGRRGRRRPWSAVGLVRAARPHSGRVRPIHGRRPSTVIRATVPRSFFDAVRCPSVPVRWPAWSGRWTRRWQAVDEDGRSWRLPADTGRLLRAQRRRHQARHMLPRAGSARGSLRDDRSGHRRGGRRYPDCRRRTTSEPRVPVTEQRLLAPAPQLPSYWSPDGTRLIVRGGSMSRDLSAAIDLLLDGGKRPGDPGARAFPSAGASSTTLVWLCLRRLVEARITDLSGNVLCAR